MVVEVFDISIENIIVILVDIDLVLYDLGLYVLSIIYVIGMVVVKVV